MPMRHNARRSVSIDERVTLRVDVQHCKKGDRVRISCPPHYADKDGVIDLRNILVTATCKAGHTILLGGDDIK